MNLAACIIIAILNAIGTWVYLMFFTSQKRIEGKTAEIKEAAGETEIEKTTEDSIKEEGPEKEPENESESENELEEESGKSHKHLITVYSIFVLAVFIGLAVAIHIIYVDNTILENIKSFVLLGILAVACATDIKEKIIPNALILYGMLVRVIIAFVEFFKFGWDDYFIIFKNDMLAIAFVVVLFLLCGLIVKNGVGMGDVKMVLVMGMFQGFTGMISSVFMSLVVAFFVAVFFLISRKKSRKDSMEFAPSLFIGTIISLILAGH